MLSHRPYRKSKGIPAALEEVALGSGKLYDPKIFVACLKAFKEDSYTFRVEV